MAADERRCPRCGSYFQEDRRTTDRRTAIRRENPSNDPGPPVAEPAKGDGKKAKGAAGAPPERRAADRRTGQRRGGRKELPPGAGTDSGGWQD
jgi:hypothetical protein